MIKLPSVKRQLVIFLLCFALFLSVKDREAVFLWNIFLAIIFTLAIDSFVIYLREKRFLISTSSIITGLIIGYVLSSDQPWWIFLVASLSAVFSKRFIRINKRHLFNPAAFGIFSVILFFNAFTQWKGAYPWYIIVPFGFYFAYKVRRLEVLFSYGIVSFLLFGTQAIMRGVCLLNILGYLNYFFIFIMLIEPKTTPIRPPGKVIFGIAVAVAIFILTEAGFRFDVELFGLLVLNLALPLLDRIPERSKG